MFNKRLFTLLLILVLALAACGGDDGDDDSDSDTDQDTTSQTQDDTTDETEEAPAPTDEPEDEVTLEIPEGYIENDIVTELFTNAFDEEPFALVQFAGRPVLVQMFTLGCTDCQESQDLIRDEIIPELGTEDFVFVSLSTNNSDLFPDIIAFAEEGEYDWLFARIERDTRFLLQRVLGPAGANGPGSARFYVSPNGELSDIEIRAIDPEAAIATMRELAESSADAGTEAEATEDADMSEDMEATPEAEATEDADMSEDMEATEEAMDADDAEATEEAMEDDDTEETPEAEATEES